MDQLEQANTQDTPSTEAPVVDSGAPRKLAGKFESVEELEKSYAELEKARTQDRMEFSTVREELGQVKSALEQFAYGQSQREAFRPMQDPDPQARSQAVLTRFYADPEGTLREVEERAYTRLRQEQAINQDRVAVIQQWTNDNPDLAQYPELVKYYVEQTDGRLNPRTRLDQAAPKVRARILELKGHREPSNPQPGDRIEAPGGGSGVPTQRQPVQAAPTSREAELRAYVAERQALSSKIMPSHQK